MVKDFALMEAENSYFSNLSRRAFLSGFGSRLYRRGGVVLPRFYLFGGLLPGKGSGN